MLFPVILEYSYQEWLNIIGNIFRNLWASGIVVAFAAVLLIPLAIKTITFNRREAKISTAEEFESKFKDLLEGKEKIVIFIDDLDRCNTKTVKLILDSLKTFFQHRECSYIITGDHTVIERYAAEELQLPEEMSLQQKLQEGRRFLKKLFDVYWRLPLPTPQQFSIFVNDEITNSNIVFKDNTQLVNFKSFLLDDNLFERNPRHVKRFITKVRFPIESIHLQIKELEGLQEPNASVMDSQKALEEILNNPDLLAKVLLFEEFSYPLYERLVLQPAELITHEKSLRSGVEPKELSIGKEKVLNILENRQEELEKYILLVNRNPKFTDENNSVIHEVANYFSFSGSTGLPSIRGPDESKIPDYLKNGQLVEQFGKILIEGTTKERNKYFSDKALKVFQESQEQEKVNVISESLKMAAILNEWAKDLESWKQNFDSLPVDKQNTTAKLLFSALLRKRPELMAEVIRGKPNFAILLWETVDSDDASKFHKETHTHLSVVAVNHLDESSPNLKAIEIYLKKISKDIRPEIEKRLVDPNACKNYLTQLKIDNLSEGNLASITKTKLESFLDQIDWVAQNKDFLKEIDLFAVAQQKIRNLAKKADYLPHIIELRDVFEFIDADREELYNNLVEQVKKSNLELLTKPSVQNFLNKDQKIQIFQVLVNIFASNKALQKRISVADLLSQNNQLWVSISKDDIQGVLRRLKVAKVQRNKELSEKRQTVLVSWGYEETKK
ncbi:MAG: hypothetical protein COS26_00435 [Candidatus Nealsonbacteria bacterium CG02_land_8_20_14_3_00_40_11]|uniref:KAP NTPase domain-containing protein n=1 Tax=Candidatus Nealsonbacteria bacterium CG02_land_8_20_14_3_00_40_11 TaxID=1974700 RepID=A0A2M7D8J8_9BACT|nr:MAG: hypothetical protein COS26_00435 [Candidatus Nealsonbacteria bacterium CG02_land_8_20_14_3_00_40_11]